MSIFWFFALPNEITLTAIYALPFIIETEFYYQWDHFGIGTNVHIIPLAAVCMT